MPKINNRKYKWKVDPIGTGPFASFQSRAWPTLESYDDGEEYDAGFIKSDISYSPRDAQRTDLKLRVVIYDWEKPQERKTRVSRLLFTNLKDAKAYLEKLVGLYPNFVRDSSKLSLLRKL